MLQGIPFYLIPKSNTQGGWNKRARYSLLQILSQNLQVCCPPKDVILFPDELEVYNAMKTASIATEDYFYNYGPQQDIDDYVDTSYLECPKHCVRHSFCNLTGIQ